MFKCKKKLYKAKDYKEMALRLIGIFFYTGIGTVVLIVAGCILAFIKWLF